MQWCCHRGQNGLRDAVKDLDFSPAHKDKVLAATCEDGSCTLWAWERQLQIAVLDLPQGQEPPDLHHNTSILLNVGILAICICIFAAVLHNVLSSMV